MRPWNYYGNDWAVDLLKKHLKSDNVRHAYMISGPNGIGRRTLATRLCQAIFCENGVDQEPCLKCKTCQNLEEGKYFDLKVITRIPGKKDILVEQVREAEAFLRITPYGTKKKVVVFSDFDLANQQTQNALLKTLEEAPAYAVLIILVENPLSLLPTVVSRCEIITLRPQQLEVVTEFLTEKGAPANTLNLIANLAEGKPGTAFRLAFEDTEELKDREEWINDLFSLMSAPMPDQFTYIENLVIKDKKAGDQAKLKAKKMMAKRPTKLSEEELAIEEEDPLEEGMIELLLLTWLGIFRDVYIRSIHSSTPIKNIDFAEKIDHYAREWSEEKCLTMMGSIESAIEQSRMNVTKKLVLEAMFLRI